MMMMKIFVCFFSLSLADYHVHTQIKKKEKILLERTVTCILSLYLSFESFGFFFSL